MRQTSVNLLWGTGVLTAVFAISVGLSWWYFGYLDVAVVGHIVRVLGPVWLVTAAILAVGEARASARKLPRVEPPEGRKADYARHGGPRIHPTPENSHA